MYHVDGIDCALRSARELATGLVLHLVSEHRQAVGALLVRRLVSEAAMAPQVRGTQQISKCMTFEHISAILEAISHCFLRSANRKKQGK